jgi:hypothetical protein
MEPQEDALDRQLREAAPYIEDGGFTSRVLQSLPSAKKRKRSLRGIILIGSSAVASALAYILSDGGRTLVLSTSRLTAVPLMWVLVAALASGVLMMAGGVAAAVSKPGQSQR